jgi:hypothetical protein
MIVSRYSRYFPKIILLIEKNQSHNFLADDGVCIPKPYPSSEMEIHHYKTCFLNCPLYSPINVCYNNKSNTKFNKKLPFKWQKNKNIVVINKT